MNDPLSLQSSARSQSSGPSPAFQADRSAGVAVPDFADFNNSQLESIGAAYRMGSLQIRYQEAVVLAEPVGSHHAMSDRALGISVLNAACQQLTEDSSFRDRFPDSAVANRVLRAVMDVAFDATYANAFECAASSVFDDELGAADLQLIDITLELRRVAIHRVVRWNGDADGTGLFMQHVVKVAVKSDEPTLIVYPPHVRTADVAMYCRLLSSGKDNVFGKLVQQFVAGRYGTEAELREPPRDLRYGLLLDRLGSHPVSRFAIGTYVHELTFGNALPSGEGEASLGEMAVYAVQRVGSFLPPSDVLSLGLVHRRSRDALSDMMKAARVERLREYVTDNIALDLDDALYDSIPDFGRYGGIGRRLENVRDELGRHDCPSTDHVRLLQLLIVQADRFRTVARKFPDPAHRETAIDAAARVCSALVDELAGLAAPDDICQPWFVDILAAESDWKVSTQTLLDRIETLPSSLHVGLLLVVAGRCFRHTDWLTVSDALRRLSMDAATARSVLVRVNGWSETFYPETLVEHLHTWAGLLNDPERELEAVGKRLGSYWQRQIQYFRQDRMLDPLDFASAEMPEDVS